MSVTHDVERGQQAETVLQNPIYCEAYSLIEKGILKKWQESADAEEREELHKLQKLLGKVRNLMESTMRSGQIAAKELERKRRLSERLGLRQRGSWQP